MELRLLYHPCRNHSKNRSITAESCPGHETRRRTIIISGGGGVLKSLREPSAEAFNVMVTRDKSYDMPYNQRHLLDLDSNISRKYCRFRDSVLDGPCLLNRNWIKQKGWVAVPREYHGMISAVELERIVIALTNFHINELIVIFPTVVEEECNCNSFAANLEALMEAVCVPSFSFLITNIGDPVFIYHHTQEDYSFLAGRGELVEAALGASIESAWHDWHLNVMRPGWPESEREFFTDIERWYSAI